MVKLKANKSGTKINFFNPLVIAKVAERDDGYCFLDITGGSRITSWTIYEDLKSVIEKIDEAMGEKVVA